MSKKDRRLPLLAGIFLFLFVMFTDSISAQENHLLYNQEFERGWPSEWQSDPGWEILDKDSNYVLAGRGHHWTNLTSAVWEDYIFSFDIQLEPDALVHANYRLQEGPLRYYVGIHQNYIYLSKQLGPEQFQEALAEGPGIGPGWHRVEIIGTGSEILVRVDGQEFLSFSDPDPILSGGVAFESVQESEVLIDNVEIWGDGKALNLPPQALDDEAESESEVSAAGPGSLSWVRLGGPPGGLGYDIRYNFDNPDIWYVTDANSGVHISTDNGLTWKQSNQGIDTVSGGAGDGIPIFSLTVDPQNPDILWIGTDHSGDIYKSTDAGSTWQKKSTGVIHEHDVLLSFRGFTVHPHDSDTVFAMGELQRPGNNVWGENVGGVIYKTSDGGDHWTLIWNGGIPSSLTRYMWINPDNPDILYVSTGIFDRGAVGEKDESDPNPFGGLGVLKSTDGGQTWRILGKENGLDFLYIGSLFMHPEDPDILFAAAGKIVPEKAYERMVLENDSPMGIYRTKNGGETWQEILKPEGGLLVQTFCAVEICPGNPDIIYAGSDIAVYRSLNGGDTWELRTGESGTWGPPGVRAGWPIDMQCDPRNSDRVFADNYSGGAFLSEDGGKTWINASSGYSGAQIIGVAVDPFDPARVLAAGRSGAWFSTDGGATWSGIHNPGDPAPLAGGEWGGVAFDPQNQDHILLSSETVLEWLPTNNQWMDRGYQPDFGPETSEIEFAPSDPNYVYAVSANHNTMVHAYNYEAGKGIKLSKNGGSNWEIITGSAFSEAILTDVAVDHTDPRVVYVAAQNGLFQSQDSGESWTKLTVSSPQESVRSIAVHPENPDLLYSGLSGVGFFISSDGGFTWKQVFAGLEPNGDIRDIIFDLSNPNTMFVADITSGIYRSTDGGETWTGINQGLSNRAATTLSLSADSNHLYAGTAGGGVFRLDLNGIPPIPASEFPVDQDTADETPQREVEPPDTAMPNQIDEDTEEEITRTLPCLGGLVPLLFAGMFFINKQKR